MSMQNVVERILSDANADAQKSIADAQAKGEKLIAEAKAREERSRRESESLVRQKTVAILDKRAADARLECAKIALREKGKVIDGVYALALARLLALEEEDSLQLFGGLLERYAEEGDTVYFAENFRFVDKLVLHPVVEEKGLRFSSERIQIDGGMRLVGKVSDKDLSFGALLAADKDENQAQLAKALF